MRKNRSAEEPLKRWILKTACLERHCRADGRSLLVVRAIYPILIEAEEAEEATVTAYVSAAERFNACYAEAAEGFIQGGMEALGPRVQTQFEATDATARPSFLRRELVCLMSAAPCSVSEPTGRSAREGELCEVTVRRTYGVRRREAEEKILVGRHLWQFPHGLLTGQLPKYKKSCEKLLKNQG